LAGGALQLAPSVTLSGVGVAGDARAGLVLKNMVGEPTHDHARHGRWTREPDGSTTVRFADAQWIVIYRLGAVAAPMSFRARAARTGSRRIVGERRGRVLACRTLD
jgi:hypothetical protein